MTKRIVMPLLAIVALLSVACASDTALTPASTTASPLSGTIEIDGSSTVFPVSEAAAEEFGKVQPKVRVNVGVSGTGGGFKRFAVGETDISGASRSIMDKEKKIAIENGISYHEILVATDGLSIVASNKNDFIACLTVHELKKIWEPGSTITKWSQVRSSFPAEDIKLYGPDTDSGTFDYFTEQIIGETQSSRADYQASADDNTLVRGISGTKYALGYFGYSYYIANKDKLKIIAIDNGTGCVEPNPMTIENGSYSPLSRPLFIYVSKKSLNRPEVKLFVEYYLEMARELVAEVDYIPLSSEKYDASIQLIQ